MTHKNTGAERPESEQKTNAKRTTNPRWIMTVTDLPPDDGTALFEFRWPDDVTKRARLGGRMRQVLEAMQRGPLFCASTVRLSDAVFRLKEGLGRAAHVKGTTAAGRKFYALNVHVKRVNAEVGK